MKVRNQKLQQRYISTVVRNVAVYKKVQFVTAANFNRARAVGS